MASDRGGDYLGSGGANAGRRRRAGVLDTIAIPCYSGGFLSGPVDDMAVPAVATVGDEVGGGAGFSLQRASARLPRAILPIKRQARTMFERRNRGLKPAAG